MLSNYFFCIPKFSYSPFVKLGWHHWSFKNKENVSASGNHEFYGVGLDGKINETIKYRVGYHKRLAYLEGKEIISLVDYAKKYQISHSNLINKAKRQTMLFMVLVLMEKLMTQ
jgi:hypothetical protein